jgi:hypothetical protein
VMPYPSPSMKFEPLTQLARVDCRHLNVAT